MSLKPKPEPLPIPNPSKTHLHAVVQDDTKSSRPKTPTDFFGTPLSSISPAGIPQQLPPSPLSPGPAPGPEPHLPTGATPSCPPAAAAAAVTMLTTDSSSGTSELSHSLSSSRSSSSRSSWDNSAQSTGMSRTPSSYTTSATTSPETKLSQLPQPPNLPSIPPPAASGPKTITPTPTTAPTATTTSCPRPRAHFRSLDLLEKCEHRKAGRDVWICDHKGPSKSERDRRRKSLGEVAAVEVIALEGEAAAGAGVVSVEDEKEKMGGSSGLMRASCLRLGRPNMRRATSVESIFTSRPSTPLFASSVDPLASGSGGGGATTGDPKTAMVGSTPNTKMTPRKKNVVSSLAMGA